MRIVIRVDSSLDIGSGHVMRCLTLAEHMKLAGSEVRFICRELAGNVSSLIEPRGFQVDRLPPPGSDHTKARTGHDDYAGWLGVEADLDARQTADILTNDSCRPDWLVVDHYALDESWHEAMREHCGAIMVIDDLANRRHNCDLLLDANLSTAGAARYAVLVSDNCTLLCGPRYALLRPEFVAAADNIRSRDGAVHRILIFLGGVDQAGHTLAACRAVETVAGETLRAEVVVGASSPHKDDVRAFCEEHSSFRFHCQVDCMAELMNEADLAVGAGGTTTWERAWLGLPTIILAVAENQLPGSRAMSAAGAAWMLQASELNSMNALVDAVRFACDHPEDVRQMSLRARAIFGDQPTPGVALVAQAMRDRIHA